MYYDHEWVLIQGVWRHPNGREMWHCHLGWYVPGVSWNGTQNYRFSAVDLAIDMGWRDFPGVY